MRRLRDRSVDGRFELQLVERELPRTPDLSEIEDQATRLMLEKMQLELRQTFDSKLEKLILLNLPTMITQAADDLMATLPMRIADEIVPTLHETLEEKRDQLIEKSLVEVANQLGRDAT